MRTKAILITGAAGEIGSALIEALAGQETRLLTLDLSDLPEGLRGLSTHIQGDILDESLLARLVSEYEFESIFHLAALLSTRGEFTPAQAHRVNVEGTLGLLKVAAENADVETDDPTRKPVVRFQSFGESSLEFVLVLWIKNVIKIRQVNSDLHHEIFTNLRKAEVVIAFPQRDIHLYEVS